MFSPILNRLKVRNISFSVTERKGALDKNISIFQRIKKLCCIGLETKEETLCEFWYLLWRSYVAEIVA
jgi:hypothetical protein